MNFDNLPYNLEHWSDDDLSRAIIALKAEAKRRVDADRQALRERERLLCDYTLITLKEHK